MPETNEEAYATNTKEQYEELGRFVEAFELMVNEVRETCIDLLSKDGDHRDLVRIAFHHQSLSAKPSIEIMRTIVTEVVSNPSSFHHGDKEIFVEVLGKIQGAYEHLSNMRNNLLHGTWFVGFVSEDDPNAERFTCANTQRAPAALRKSGCQKRQRNFADLETIATSLGAGSASSYFAYRIKPKSPITLNTATEYGC